MIFRPRPCCPVARTAILETPAAGLGGYRNMERLGTILDRTVKRLPLKRRLDDYALWAIWDDTVGPAVARNAQPEKIRNGTLFVRVRAPTWMQQLQYMKDVMVEKLNQRLEREAVTNIFFVVGEIRAETPPEGADAPPSAVDATRLPVRDLGRIEDPELRDALRRLLLNHLRKRA